MIREVTLTALLGAAVVTQVSAKPLTVIPAQLDAAKAYILVEIDTDRRKPAGQIMFARYDRDKADVRGRGRSTAGSAKVPPGEATQKPVLKDSGRAMYLMEVDPDFWVVEGANGRAFSLGSSGVALAPGSVTDMGVAMIGADMGEGDAPEKLTAGKLAKIALLGPFGGSLKPKPVPAMVDFRPRTATDLTIPAPLQSRAVAAAWSPPVKFGNYLGGLVNRMGGRKARLVAPDVTLR